MGAQSIKNKHFSSKTFAALRYFLNNFERLKRADNTRQCTHRAKRRTIVNPVGKLWRFGHQRPITRKRNIIAIA